MIYNNNIQDQEFRDYSAPMLYPFADNAVLGDNKGIIISSNTFIDILIYTYTDLKLPIYLTRCIYINETKMQIEFTDSRNILIANTIVDIGEGKDSSIITSNEITAGVLVYDSIEIESLLDATKNVGSVYFGKNLPIIASKCIQYTPKALFSINNKKASDIYIRAAKGVKFTKEGDSVLIHLLGEEPVKKPMVYTINGYSYDHLWLAAHPNSSVKIGVVNKELHMRCICDD